MKRIVETKSHYSRRLFILPLLPNLRHQFGDKKKAKKKKSFLNEDDFRDQFVCSMHLLCKFLDKQSHGSFLGRLLMNQV